MKKKLLRIFFAFIMFFSVLPTQHIYNKEETKIEAAYSTTDQKLIFCEPSSDWKQSGAKFAVYLWTDGVAGDEWKLMSQVSGQSYYYAAIPSSRNRAILVRMNSSTTSSSLNWDNKWNQTQNLILDQSNTNYYKITGWDNSCTGSSKSYTINYDKNEGTGNMSGQSIAFYSTTLTKNAFTRTGYTFTGWNTTSDGSGDSYTDGQSIGCLTNVTGSTVTLYAQWKANNYTVTFNPNGDGASTSTTSKSVTYNSTYGTLPTPTRTGYTFNGWFTASSGGTQVTSSTTVALLNDQTLYAHWTANTYSVVYNANGGTGTMENSSHTYGTPSSLRANTFTLTGHSFSGWNTADNGSGTSYSDQQSVSTLTSTNNGTVTLYAQWAANTYTVTLDNQGADISSGTTSVQVTYNGELPTITIPEKTGYKFKGYYSVKNSTSNTYKYYNQDGKPYSAHKIYTLTEDTTYYATWEAKEFTINFNINYDGGVNPNSTTVTYDSYYDLPIPERDGYVFKGWNSGSSGGGAVWLVNGEQVKITQGYTVYAIWVLPIPHNLTLHLNGGLINESTEDVIHTVNETLLYNLPTPIRTGYTFNGWYQTADFQNKVEANDEVPEVGEGNLFTDLYAKWTINQYTISFEENGGSTVADITQNYATTVTKPTDPTKTGHTFGGWYSDSGCTNPYTFNTMPATDITLYAKWTINQYTISFEENGGSTVADITQNYATTVTKPTDPTRTGYTFSGWFTDNGTFENEYTFDTMPLDGITLYAKWTPINYKITFVENGGSTVADITQGYETKITKPTDPTKTGYTFGGWFTDNETFEDEFVFDTMPLNGTTLYAKWIAKTYSVTLDKQGGEGGTSSFTATYGIRPSIEVPTREGYTFNGYFTGTNGTGTQMYYETGSAYRNWNIDSDTTLYAKWTANVCNLNFNLNYADSPANPDAVNVTYNQIMNLPVPTRTGYTFLGWNTDPSGTGTYYRNGEICKITAGSNILYAIWEVKVYNIEINLDGGSILNQNLPSSYTIETESFNLPTPKKDGWTFEGWYDGNNLYKTVSFTQGVTIDDKSYTAIWTQKITIIVNLSDLTSANVNNVYVHFWGTGTGPGWKDPIEKMQLVDANEKKYQLDIVFASSNTSLVKTCGLTEIKNVILAYTETSGTFPGDKKTEDMIVSPTITAADNGKIYKFKFEGSVWENSTLTNATFGEIITLTYMDGDVVKYTEEITTKEAIQHKFYEKEGFKLEGWYEDPSFTGERHENGITTSVSLTLYAHYVPADDFYLYIDTTELTAWEITHVYFWSNYFAAHDNSWPGTDTGIIDLKNGIIQIHVDASKSYDALILNDGTNQTVDITLSPQNVYYSVKNTKKAETEKYEIVYEKCLDNIMIAQKMTGDVNAFRFGTGLPTSITDLSSSNKNFGYKFIFVDEDTRNSFVGYWNFSTSNKLDAFRVGNILYKSNELDQTSDYAGFYALTLTDDVTFKYENYDKIVVIACYKDNKNVIQVIKAQEYDIHIDGEGNVSLTSIQR